MQTDIYLAPMFRKKIRKVYGFSNALSRLGGTLSVLFTTCRIIMGPISLHMYYIKAIKRLYFARTKLTNIFAKKSSSCGTEYISKFLHLEGTYGNINLDNHLKKEVKKHKMIRISLCDTILLFLYTYCPGSSYMCCCWKNQALLTQLFTEGKEKIEKSLNIFKFVRALRRLKILMKSSFINNEIKFKIAHSMKNCINLIEEDCESCDDQ